MSIRLLAVEDDPSFAEVLTRLLIDLGSDLAVQLAKSRDSAVARLEDESFDIVLLDLKLPTGDGALDADVDHGRFVLNQARVFAPGTPIVVLTGSSAESFIPSFLAISEQVDVWGDHHKIPTINFLRKSELDQLQPLLEPLFSAIRAMRDVEIRPSGDGTNLSWEEDRLIRIFVRRRGGTSCQIRQIGGGLSDARVFRVSIRDAAGAPVVSAIAKVGSTAMVRTECENYDQYCQRLNEQATPRLYEEIAYGGGRLAAVTYRLAEEYDANLFDLATADPDKCELAIGLAAKLLAPWRDGIGESQVTIGEVRRRLVSDDRAAKLRNEFDLAWTPAFESRNVQVRWCPIHGDLHGANVLVSGSAQPIFIDYGDVGPGPTALDWINLELSSIFHVDGPAQHSTWPDSSACTAWPKLDEFVKECPVPKFVRACRESAIATGAGPRELAACAYSYAFRQLAYDDTDKEKAVRIMDAARRFIEEQT